MNKTDWRTYERIDDVFNGRSYIIVKPHNAAEGTPWVWRAEFFSAFDSVDMDLLSKGWHIAYYDTSNMYGCPQAIELMKKFHDFIINEYDLSPKADIFGFSRGGLYAVNYTALYPNDISVLYLDAPVLDIRSWPAGLGLGNGAAFEWKECKEFYGLSDVRSIIEFNQNPLDKIDALIRNNIPVVLCAGEADEVVPYRENGMIFDAAFRQHSSDILTILKPLCNHHPHSIEHPEPISKFIAEHRA